MEPKTEPSINFSSNSLKPEPSFHHYFFKFRNIKIKCNHGGNLILNLFIFLKKTVFMFQVYLCGNNAEAKQAVVDVATKLGLAVLDRGSLTAARELEDIPLELFPEWRLPLRLAAGLAAFFYFYLVLRDIVFAYVEQGKDISFRLLVSMANKVKDLIGSCPFIKGCLKVCAAAVV